MGLENLKSVFAEEAGVNKSQISGRYDEDKRVQPMEDIFRDRTSAVDFFGGANSYKQTLDPAVSGFTKNFNIGGYAFGDGQLGNSKYLNVLSNTQTIVDNVDITSLNTNKLGFGKFETPDFEGDDIRFTPGIGFPLANSILQVSKQGNAASLFYTTTDGKVSVGVSGAINNFGPISDFAQSIGVEIPPLDFSADIISSKPLKYLDTVFEKNNDTPQDNMEQLPAGFLGNQQGIIFQAITPNINRSTAIKNSAPGLGPISTIEDLYEGTKGGHGAESEVTATELISRMDTGLHLYLGNQTSFVKLGPDIYQGSILDAILAGDVGYIRDKAIDFVVGVGENILDKSGDILASAGKNIADWASGFKVQTDLSGLPKPDFSKFSFKSLKGPSIDLPSMTSMGGFFDGVKLPNLSLPFSMPDIDLPDIKLPSLPSLPTPIVSFGKGVGSFAGSVGGVIGSVLPPFPKLTIKNNPDLLDLLESIKNDDFGLLKNQSKFKQGILNDIAGADGSNVANVTDGTNPRSLVYGDALPYKALGVQTPFSPAKYTDSIISKHPTESEDSDFNGEKVSKDFYPSTFGDGLPDLKTMLPVNSGNTLKEAGESYDSETYVNVAEGEKYGLPFYFKDLRDDKYIIFRGYLSGMTQNVSPDWTEHSYLGRSESTYVYSKAKRNINFTFKVYATSKPELQLIYEKLNMLTKLAYPRYKTDSQEKNRMMAPLCSLRIGELFGNSSKNVAGFIDSLNFNWPDNTVWEIEKGKRVPKECDVTVGFTVIHRSPPSHDTPEDEFFGFSLK